MKGFISHVKELGIYLGSNRKLKGHFKRGSDRTRIASRKMVMAAMGLTCLN